MEKWVSGDGGMGNEVIDLSTKSACMGNGRMGNGIAGNGNEFLTLYNHSYKVQELGNGGSGNGISSLFSTFAA